MHIVAASIAPSWASQGDSPDEALAHQLIVQGFIKNLAPGHGSRWRSCRSRSSSIAVGPFDWRSIFRYGNSRAGLGKAGPIRLSGRSTTASSACCGCPFNPSSSSTVRTSRLSSATRGRHLTRTRPQTSLSRTCSSSSAFRTSSHRARRRRNVRSCRKKDSWTPC